MHESDDGKVLPRVTEMSARFEAAAARQGDDPEPLPLPDRLCRAALEVLPVDGAAISVYEKPDIAVPVGVSDQDAAAAEALQFSLREGPCLSAFTTHRPAAIPDIEQPGSPARSHWPSYTAELSAHTPYRAVFAYPLLHEGSAVGSLSVYRLEPGTPALLGDTDVVGAVIASITRALLQAAGTSAELDDEQEHAWISGPSTVARHRVWVAQGMIMVENSLDARQALDLLRARAYSDGRMVDAVADDIITRAIPVPALDSDQ